MINNYTSKNNYQLNEKYEKAWGKIFTIHKINNGPKFGEYKTPTNLLSLRRNNITYYQGKKMSKDVKR